MSTHMGILFWGVCAVISILATILPLSLAENVVQMSQISEDQPKHSEFPKEVSIFRFAKHFQSHMVLQQAPKKANIYGFSPDIGQTVTVTLMFPASGKRYTYKTEVEPGPAPSVGYWTVSLDPMKTNESALIVAESSGMILILADVLFGDVWICSGQSNMQFMVEQIFGAADVIAESHNYPNVRFMNVHRQGSNVTQYDLISIDQAWTGPTNETVARFSAVCWLYGKTINKELGYPIGLVGTDFGGTPVEAWSSPTALAKCGINETESSRTYVAENYDQLSDFEKTFASPPQGNSVLWNAMVYPMLGMTIYGTIWYQGEQDSTTPEMMNRYNCTFPAMIDDWRLQFHNVSYGETDSMFPFGFVQLATSMPPNNPGYADIRWHQTADYGYVPNPRMPKVFMAVALDLPDFDSPSGPVHTRHKQEVGVRLSLSGLALAYSKPLMYQGPFPEAAYVVNNTIMLVDYGSKWTLDIRNPEGFEFLCSSGYHSTKTWWVPTSIISSDKKSVQLFYPVCGKGQHALALRYAWRTTPCALKTCAIYSTVNELPAPPFVAYAAEFENGKVVFEFQKE